MDFLSYVRNQWDRVGAWVCVVGGGLALLLGWLGVSDTPFPAEQIPYIMSGGLGGVFLLGLGAVLWLSADLRDEWRKLDAIERHMRESGSVPAVEERKPNGKAGTVTPEIFEIEETEPTSRRRRGGRSTRTGT